MHETWKVSIFIINSVIVRAALLLKGIKLYEPKQLSPNVPREPIQGISRQLTKHSRALLPTLGRSVLCHLFCVNKWHAVSRESPGKGISLMIWECQGNLFPKVHIGVKWFLEHLNSKSYPTWFSLHHGIINTLWRGSELLTHEIGLHQEKCRPEMPYVYFTHT